jgi:hypothetical protein
MRESFGELILKKDSILYCSSCFDINEIIETPNNNQFYLWLQIKV